MLCSRCGNEQSREWSRCGTCAEVFCHLCSTLSVSKNPCQSGIHRFTVLKTHPPDESVNSNRDLESDQMEIQLLSEKRHYNSQPIESKLVDITIPPSLSRASLALNGTGSGKDDDTDRFYSSGSNYSFALVENKSPLLNSTQSNETKQTHSGKEGKSKAFVKSGGSTPFESSTSTSDAITFCEIDFEDEVMWGDQLECERCCTIGDLSTCLKCGQSYCQQCASLNLTKNSCNDGLTHKYGLMIMRGTPKGHHRSYFFLHFLFFLFFSLFFSFFLFFFSFFPYFSAFLPFYFLHYFLFKIIISFFLNFFIILFNFLFFFYLFFYV
jgi:hypothetical protein